MLLGHVADGRFRQPRRSMPNLGLAPSSNKALMVGERATRAGTQTPSSLTQIQVYFVLNGRGKMFHAMLNPAKMPTMDKLLEEVSVGLGTAIFSLFTLGGQRIAAPGDILAISDRKVIACARNERPFLTGNDIKLPASLNDNRHAPRPVVTDNAKLSFKRPSTSNGIEKIALVKMPPITKGLRKPKASAVAKPTKEIMKKKQQQQPEALKRQKARQIKNEMEEIEATIHEKADDHDSGTGNSVASSWHTDEPESGRAASSAELKAQMIREETMARLSEDDLILEEESDRQTPDSVLDSTGPNTRPPSEFLEKAETPAVETPLSRKSTATPGTPAVHTPEKREAQETPSSPEKPSPDAQVPETEEVQKTEESETPTVETPSSEREDTPAVTTPDPSDQVDVEDEAARKIQNAFKNFKTRKEEKTEKEQEEEELDDIQDDEGKSLKTPSSGNVTYTIEVKLGFRYGGSSESDLYLIIHGDDAVSQKILLSQKADWLLQDSENRPEGESIRFYVDSPFLGTINKLVVGHKNPGYGAGLFIEYIMIAESVLDARQFMFFCNKWFDGGQVDGKIERTVFLSTFLYNIPVTEQASRTQGRWEFILHTRKDEFGGTTSNLTFAGYSQTACAMTLIENDKTIQDWKLNPLIQVDFGEIGSIIKVRIEIDGAGDRPNYFLEYVEVRDLDTEERSAVSVNKWLATKPTSEMKKWQPFREISIYRPNAIPYTMTSFEGKVSIGDMSLTEGDLSAQLIGSHGESGHFPILRAEGNGKTVYSFKVDCVQLGNVRELKLFPSLSQQGQAVLEGLEVLEELYNKYKLDIPTGDALFATEAVVRETSHTPFRYILSESHVTGQSADGEPLAKTMRLRVVEGMSTKKKVKKGEKQKPSKASSYTLSVSVDDSDNFSIPRIVLVTNQGDELELKPASKAPINGIVNYQLKTKEFHEIEKVRLFAGEPESGKTIMIRKMRLVESQSGMEVRLSVFSEVHQFEVLEVMCVYPDVAPRISYVYSIQLHTVKKKGKFRPYIKLIGTEGDSGFRPYPGLTDFPENTNAQMEIEAVDLGKLQAVQVYIESKEKSLSWRLDIKVDARKQHEEHYESKKIALSKAIEPVKADLLVVETPTESAL